MKTNKSKILVIDSGFGGLSILKAVRNLLPNEDYIYFGDSKNAPYGEKSEAIVFDLASCIINKINRDFDIKACIIACNTTTVSNLSKLKMMFPELIFIGTTPNIDEMVYEIPNGDLLVVSTPITANSTYLNNKISEYKSRRIISLGMPGLMNFVEDLNFNEKDIFEYLDMNLLPFLNEDVKAISLGCTHYPFLKGIIDKYIRQHGYVLRFFDSSNKVANEIKKELINNNLLNDSDIFGELTIFNSINNDDMIEKSFMLLER